MNAWVALWDRRESPISLALVRILVATALLVDLLPLGPLGLVEAVFAPAPLGLGHLDGRPNAHELYGVLEPSSATALWALLCAALAAFGAGLFTRASGLVALFLYAQLALVLPLADRGIDMAFRNALLLLSLAPSGHALGIDARRATGSWIGHASAPAWGRQLMVVQLVVIYFLAGVQKVGLAWWPAGDWSALWLVLQDPAVARFPGGDVPYRITQFTTLSTVVFEWSAGLLPLAFLYRYRQKALGTAFRNVWVAAGVALHLGIAVTMNLGIFPWGMLALYPAFFHPDELRAAASRVRTLCTARST